MTDKSEQSEYPVVMEVADWLTINGTMDNQVWSLGQEGYDLADGQEDWGELGRDPYWAELTELGQSIMQAGWDQLPDWPDDFDSLQRWPPPGRTESMRLSGRQWSLVVSSLEHWAEVDEEVGDPEAAVARRSVAASVRRKLATQGLDPLPTVLTRGQ